MAIKKYVLEIAGITLLAAAPLYTTVLANDEVGPRVKAYFEQVFSRLEQAAQQEPTAATFRKIMRKAAEDIEGFYGATLIDENWVIRQVYNPGHFLARGYNLKNVKELEYFYKLMRESPGPQLSEPGQGSIVQPRLISMRYPMIKDGKMQGMVSLMVRTEAFLKSSGLNECRAFKIICLGKTAEERGELSDKYQEVKLALPSTEWVIQYEK